MGGTTGVVHHIRNKTSIEGRFWIPPELVIMLRKAWSKVQSPLAFTTREGHALVRFEKGKKTDAVRQSWNKLRVAAGLPGALQFKFLRKFAADYALKAGGEAMGQIALSHSRNTVMAKCYTSARDFERFHQIQRQMYAELNAAGLFTPLTDPQLEKLNSHPISVRNAA